METQLPSLQDDISSACKLLGARIDDFIFDLALQRAELDIMRREREADFDRLFTLTCIAAEYVELFTDALADNERSQALLAKADAVLAS